MLVTIAVIFDCSAAEYNKPPASTQTNLGVQQSIPAWLRALTGTISFEAREIQTPTETLTDIEIPLRATPGHMLIERAKFTASQGEVVFDIRLDKLNQRFTAAVQADHLVFARTETPSETGLIFNDEMLVPEWLTTLNGDLDIAISAAEYAKIEFKDFGGKLFLRENKLSGEVSASVENGHLRVNFEHEYAHGETQLFVMGTAVPLHLMPATRDYLVDTALNFDSTLNARGHSPRELAQTLNGLLTIEAMHGSVDVRRLEKLSQDILSLTLTSIVPITFRSDTAQLECAVIKFPIRNGVASNANAIALRTQNLAVMGGGEINFAEEKLDIRLHPHARSTAKVNTKTAVKEVKLAGPLRDIQVDAKLGGILNQGISLTTKIAALGLAKLRLPLLDWAAPAEEACMSTLSSEEP